MKLVKKPREIKYLTYPFLLFNLANEKIIINKKIRPNDPANNKAWWSTTSSKSLPKSISLPDILFLNKIKLIISEKARLAIRKYETGLVSLFIVLLKLNNSTAVKTDAIIGRPGINQEIFIIIIFNQVHFYMQPKILWLVLGDQERQGETKKIGIEVCINIKAYNIF